MQLDPDEFTIKFNVLKPDNNFVMTTFTDGVIKLSDQITAVTGTGYYCILLMQDDELIYSGNGKIIINDHVIGSENIDSVSEADGYVFPDDFYTKDTPLALLDDSTTGTDSTWSSEKIAEEIASIPGADIIDDTVTSTEKTWSSSKISEEVSAAAASEIDDTTTATDSTWSSEKISEEIEAVTPTITKEVTGNPIEFNDGADAPLVKCVTAITGYQEGTGTPSPDNVRPIVAYTEGEIDVRGKNLFDESYTGIINELTYHPIYVGDGTFTLSTTTPARSGNTANLFLLPGNVDSGASSAYSGVYQGRSVTDTAIGGYVTIAYRNYKIDPRNYKTQLEKGSTPTTYEPYTSTTHTTTYPSAIYRGSEDCVNGEVTSEWGIIASYNGETLPGEWISDRDEYAPGTTPTTGAQVAYQLATPTTSSVTPTNLPIKSLFGFNHIESSTGEMEVEYIVNDYQPIIDCIPAGPLYSTNEQITGTWTDGRPVYTRIIPVNATWQNIGTTSRQSFVYLQDWAKEIDIITDLFIIGKDQYYGYTFNAAANLDRGNGSIEACWNDPFGGLLTSVPVECVRLSYVKTASVSRNLQRTLEDIIASKIEPEGIIKGVSGDDTSIPDAVKEVLENLQEERKEDITDEVHDQEMPEPGTYDTYRE